MIQTKYPLKLNRFGIPEREQYQIKEVIISYSMLDGRFYLHDTKKEKLVGSYKGNKIGFLNALDRAKRYVGILKKRGERKE